MSNYNLDAVIRVRDAFSSPLSSFRQQISAARQSAENASSGVRSFNNSANQTGAISGLTSKLAGLAAGYLSVKGAVGLFKSVIGEASDFQSMRATLNVVMKDSQLAGEKFHQAIQFASSTPFEAKEIVSGMTKLKAYGMDTSNEMLTSVGDMAAVWSSSGKTFDDAIEAVGDSQQGELERLKEFGIKKSDIVDQANKTMAGKEIINAKGQITDQTAFNQALLSLMKERFSGGMEAQSKTFKGAVSNLKDTWSMLMAKIGGEDEQGNLIKGGLLDKVTTSMQSFGDKMKEIINNGVAEEIGNKIGNAFESIGNAVNFAKENFSTIAPIVAGVAGAFVAFNVITKVVTLFNGLSKVVSVIRTVVFAIQSFAGGAGTLGECLALISNPIGWVVGAIALLTGAFVLAWNKSEAFRTTVTNAFNSVKTKVAEVVAGIKAKIDEFKAKLDENKEAVSFIMSVLNAIFQTSVAVLGQIFATLATTIGNVVQDIGTIFGGIVGVLGGVIEIIQGIVTGDWSKVWQGIKDTVSGAIDIIKGLWQGLLDLLSTPIKAVVNITKKVFGGKDDSGEQTESTEGNYTGTSNFRGGKTEINERGYEIINLPSGTSIMNHQGSEALLDKIASGVGSQQPIINFNMNGTVIREDADIDKIMDGFVARLRKEQLKRA